MTIVAIGKGQQLETAQKVQQQKTQEKSISSDQEYRPISFPTSDEDDVMTRDKLPPQNQNQSQNANSILQSVDEKYPAHSPTMELTRPTRVAAAVAATVPVISSRYTDDQLDYIRDFSWTLFQVLPGYFLSFNLKNCK